MTEKTRTLGIFVTSVGYGYALFVDTWNVIDNGVQRIRPFTQETFLQSIETLLDIRKPQNVLLPNPDADYRTSERVKTIIRKIEKLSNERNIGISFISRKEIRQIFQPFNARNKQQVAVNIAEELELPEYMVPKPRKFYESENYWMPKFDAMALVITNYLLMD